MLDYISLLLYGLNLDEMFQLVIVFLVSVYAISFKVAKKIDKEWEEEDNSVRFFERPPNDRHHN